MSTVNVYQLLESVANVTRERDTDHLRLSLIKTLGELLPVEAADFIDLKPLPESDLSAQEPAALWAGTPPECRAAAVSCALGGLPTTEVLPESSSLLLVHPVSPEQALAVRINDMAQEEPARLVRALARLYSNFTGLIRESEQDRLTGLSNRRSFDTHLAKLAELTLTATPLEPRAAAARGPLRWWLALFDVDHFKRINDGYGHLYGDEVLLLMARIVRQMFRGEDRCFRYGGEEFAVVLARNDTQGTRVAMERLRQAVERHVFPQIGQVTISIGCAEIEPGLGPADIIDRADRALYDAKRQGRNRTVCFGDSPQRVALQRPESLVEMF